MKNFLKELKIDEELAGKILAKHDEEITTVNNELVNVKTELANTNKVVKDRDKQLEDLKKTAGDNAELKKQVEDLQEANNRADKEHKEEINALKINNAVENSLLAYKAKTPNAVKALLNMENIKLDEKGNVTGINEQLKTLLEAEDTKYLFSDDKPNFKGAQPGFSPDNNENFDTSKMTYSQMCAYLEKNPDAKI